MVTTRKLIGNHGYNIRVKGFQNTVVAENFSCSAISQTYARSGISLPVLSTPGRGCPFWGGRDAFRARAEGKDIFQKSTAAIRRWEQSVTS
jgi:hypothetical protein